MNETPKEMNMNIETPKDWRKGQMIANFLKWLNEEKEYPTEFIDGGWTNGFMADPFYIEDKEWDKLFKEFLKLHEKN